MQVASARVKANFGKAAATYDARAKFQHNETRRVLDAALMLLPEVAIIADIGCGTGYFAANAKTTRPDWRTIGIDIAPGMCKVAAARCTAIAGDAAQLPLADGTLDAAVSSLCYQWVENQETAFKELARVLKPGGRAIIASLGEQSLQELRASSTAVDLPLSTLPMREFKTAKALVKGCGFDVIFDEQRMIQQYYPSVSILLESMRGIGAGNNFSKGTRHVVGPKRWAAMVAEYEKLRVPQGIPATWEHHFFVLRKR